MTRYYKLIEHANTTDDPEDVVSIISSEEEPRNIERLLVTSTTNLGYLKGNVERETLFNHLTNKATFDNFLEIPVEEELAIGDTFELTLQNETAGTNAEIYGLVEYSIRG